MISILLHKVVFFRNFHGETLSFRQYIPPKILHPDHLQELDASEYEEIAGPPKLLRTLSYGEIGTPESGTEDSEDQFYDAEILDEMTTHRGELKFRTVGSKDDRFYQVHP